MNTVLSVMYMYSVGNCYLFLFHVHVGVLGSLKTCLHSVLQLVAIGDNPREPSGCQITHPKLAEKCYHLLYLMCVNKNLTGYVMRYLRNNHNYFHVQLSNVPFPWLHELQDPVVSLQQQSWILCSVALELRMTLLKNQQSHSQQLVTLLLKSTTLTDQFTDVTLTSGQVPVWSTDGHIDFDSSHSLDPTGNEGRRKILTILDYISFDLLQVPSLQLQFFDSDRTESVIKSCEVRDENDCSYTDVQALRGLLMSELNSIQGAAVVSQKHFILQVSDPCIHVLYMPQFHVYNFNVDKSVFFTNIFYSTETKFI